MLDLPHPPLHDLPRPDELGPDPEPLDSQRAEVLFERVAARQKPRLAYSAPRTTMRLRDRVG